LRQNGKNGNIEERRKNYKRKRRREKWEARREGQKAREGDGKRERKWAVGGGAVEDR
jgi:hypothetical protein